MILKKLPEVIIDRYNNIIYHTLQIRINYTLVVNRVIVAVLERHACQKTNVQTDVRFLNAWNTQTNGILSLLHSLLLDGVGYAMRMLFEKLSCILTGAYIKKVHCQHFFTKYASLFQKTAN